MSAMSTRLWILAACVVGPLSLNACGGGDDSVETLPVITSPVPAAPATPAAPEQTTTTVGQEAEFYTIQQGDTLFGIAEAFGVTMDEIISFNAIADPDAIQAGQRIQIPPGGTPPMPTAPPSTTTTVPAP